jgi:hypothetical protein
LPQYPSQMCVKRFPLLINSTSKTFFVLIIVYVSSRFFFTICILFLWIHSSIFEFFYFSRKNPQKNLQKIKSAGKFASFLRILVLWTKIKRFELTRMNSQEKTKTKKSRIYMDLNNI